MRQKHEFMSSQLFAAGFETYFSSRAMRHHASVKMFFFYRATLNFLTFDQVTIRDICILLFFGMKSILGSR